MLFRQLLHFLTDNMLLPPTFFVQECTVFSLVCIYTCNFYKKLSDFQHLSIRASFVLKRCRIWGSRLHPFEIFPYFILHRKILAVHRLGTSSFPEIWLSPGSCDILSAWQKNSLHFLGACLYTFIRPQFVRGCREVASSSQHAANTQ